MATHLREQITAAVVTALTGLTTTGARVYRARARALQDTELPGLIITGGSESPAISSMGNGQVLERTMRVMIAAHVKAVSSYDTTLNLILKEVEIALAAAALGGGKYATPADIAEPEISEDGEKPVARQVFTFEVLYYTQSGVPDVAL